MKDSFEKIQGFVNEKDKSFQEKADQIIESCEEKIKDKIEALTEKRSAVYKELEKISNENDENFKTEKFKELVKKLKEIREEIREGRKLLEKALLEKSKNQSQIRTDKQRIDKAA